MGNLNMNLTHVKCDRCGDPDLHVIRLQPPMKKGNVVYLECGEALCWSCYTKQDAELIVQNAIAGYYEGEER
jgi:hypothetical protein